METSKHLPSDRMQWLTVVGTGVLVAAITALELQSPVLAHAAPSAAPEARADPARCNPGSAGLQRTVTPDASAKCRSR